MIINIFVLWGITISIHDPASCYKMRTTTSIFTQSHLVMSYKSELMTENLHNIAMC